MKAVVLLSGGLDSTVCFKRAVDETEVRLALTFDYGQAAVERELEAAREMTRRYGVKHAVIDLPWMEELLPARLQKGSRWEEKPDEEAAASVWVPNRNGVFVNVAAAFAEAMDCEQVVAGFNAEEGALFPDNSREYINAANAALGLSTMKKSKLVSYTADKSKAEILRMAREVKAPLDLVWSCYYGGEEMCGDCLSCQKLLRALKQEWNEDLEVLASRIKK